MMQKLFYIREIKELLDYVYYEIGGALPRLEKTG